MGIPVEAQKTLLSRKPLSMSALKQDPRIKKELLLKELQDGRKDIMSNRIMLHDVNTHIAMFYK